MLSNEHPASDQLRVVFEEALADAIAGRGVAEGIGLDEETMAALLAVDETAPNPPSVLIRCARNEFEELIADIVSVERGGCGETIPLPELLKELEIDDEPGI